MKKAALLALPFEYIDDLGLVSVRCCQMVIQAAPGTGLHTGKGVFFLWK